MTRKDLLFPRFFANIRTNLFTRIERKYFHFEPLKIPNFLSKKKFKFENKNKTKKLDEKMKNLGAPMFTIYLLQWPLCYLADLLITLVEEVGTPIS